MRSSKQHAVVNFTIHSLRLPEEIQDPFQIEFKRGSTTGMTEKIFCTADTSSTTNQSSSGEGGSFEVLFEKHFRCAVTLIPEKRSKSDNKKSKSKSKHHKHHNKDGKDDKDDKDEKEEEKMYHKKKIAFTVYRYRNTSSKKVFGKFQIDASNYLTLKTDTFEVESPHSKKSFAVITMGVNFTKSGGKIDGNTMTDQDMVSQSEAIQLTTDRTDEWDVSDMITPQKKEEIQTFFMRREAEKNEQRSQLKDFTVVSNREKRLHRPRPPSRGGIPSPQTNGPDVNLMKLNAFLRPAANKNETAPQSTNFSNSRSKSGPLLPIKRSSSSSGLVPSLNPSPTNTKTKSKKNKDNDSDDNTDSESTDNEEKVTSENENNDNDNDNENENKERNNNRNENGNKNENNETKEPKKKSKEMNEKTANLFLRSVLAKFWEASPLDLSSMPKTAAILAAATLHAKLFDQGKYELEVFQDLINEFVSNYSSSELIERATKLEKWFLTLYMLASLDDLKRTIDDLDAEKVDLFYNALNGVCSAQFDNLINDLLNQFEPIAQQMVLGEISNDQIVSLLDSAMQSMLSLLIYGCPEPMNGFIVARVLCLFDIVLIKTIFETPEKCEFEVAAKWNSGSSMICAENEKYVFNKFRQAAMVFMMSSIICNDPACKNDICPDLAPQVVIKLLRMQKVDEFLPAPNDTTEFQKFHNLADDELEVELPMEYSGTFDQIVHELKVADWDTYSFNKETLEAYPFLSSYF